MIRPPAVKGTPEQRRAARAERREANRTNHVIQRAEQARSGRERVVVACNAALAEAKRNTAAGQVALAAAIGAVVKAAKQARLEGKTL